MSSSQQEVGTSRRRRAITATAVLAAAGALSLAAVTPATASSSTAPKHPGKIRGYQLDGTRFASTAKRAAASKSTRALAAAPAVSALTNFGRTNTDASTGSTYQDTYVGLSPTTNSSSTAAVNIVPLNLRLQNSNGSYTTISASSTATTVAGSPLFTNTTTKPAGESTQYIDAYVRANWNKVGTGYHLKLAPTVQPALTVTLSYNDWFSYGSSTVFNDNTLSPAVRAKLGNYSASAFTVFVAPNVIGCTDWGIDSQCYGGYHDYSNSRTYSITTVDNTTNLQALSHETAEWAMDPFVNNSAPNWTTGGAYGCNNILEVGDPVYKSTYASGNWTLEDEVYNAWFFHTSPAPTFNKAYSLLGLNTSAQTC